MGVRMRGIALAMAVCMAAIPVFAQQTNQNQTIRTSPFLTLDQERMYQQSDFGKRVAADLNSKAEALSAENRRIDAALTLEEQRLTEERPTMEVAVFRELAVDFDERVTAIRRAQSAKQAAIQQQGDQERARFFELAFPVLLRLVEETGAVAILNNSAVIFSVRNLDITDEAVRRINTVVGDAPLDPVPGPQPVPRPQSDP
jgi:Skp family chaperone for outer membrane proteins